MTPAIAATGEQPALLRIRFTGSQLNSRRVPIYELAQALTAAQSIVNKAYLLGQDRLRGRVSLRTFERQLLALQLSSVSRGSDIYDFTPFTPDKLTRQILEDIAISSVEALDRYRGCINKIFRLATITEYILHLLLQSQKHISSLKK
jgi:hypothetical protein